MTSNVQPAKPAAARNTLVIIAIIGVAVIAALAAILVVNRSATVSAKSYDDVPMARTADGGFILGNPDARVTIVEFADFACPHCIDYLETSERVINDFVKTGQAKFEYRTFPTAGGQVTAFLGTIAVCLDEQRPGAFWQVKDMLYQMASSGRYDGNTGRTIAASLGLDYSKALACAQSQQQIETDIALAQRVGVQGTPAVLIRVDDGDLEWIQIGGQRYDRGGAPYEVIAAAINAYP